MLRETNATAQRDAIMLHFEYIPSIFDSALALQKLLQKTANLDMKKIFVEIFCAFMTVVKTFLYCEPGDIERYQSSNI